ncbi:tetratricopeptide repeat protein [Paraburkholderia silviterrae]|uniref:Tetratricopeptide repeat protein n=1 Tax=Paraburkholderia silviterrae TaxID=2528715 RepID=A0A4R5M9K5_9BURK|nr:tetratricopeptide repeat-containing glycosyltransferase family protein [Paraburkholderia silviterrae]TDG23297.1 tetratricopeptide repeat protein [Paraburkholderia silviterrae]
MWTAESWLTSQSLYASGHYGEALSHLEQLLQSAPSHRQAIELAARCLDKLHHAPGEQPDTQSAQRAQVRAADQAAALNSLGCWFYGRGQLPQAEHTLELALSVKPDWPEALSNLGLVLRAQRRETEAEATLRRALAIAPDYAGARNNLAVLLWQTKRLEQAEAQYRQILGIQPGYALAHNNLGLVLLDLGRPQDAEVAFRHALAIDTRTPAMHNNLGNALNQQGRSSEAIAAYREALSLRPDYTTARGNLAMLLLRLGAFEEGWRHFEARNDESAGTASGKRPPVPYPQWRGEPLEGKSLLVWPEQGYGDLLQFCRYLPLLKARGVARLGVACPPALKRLFEGMEGVDALYPLDGTGTIPGHDYWCLMLSLPMHFGTTLDTIPAHTPYLRAPADLTREWSARLPSGGFKAGLVWAGDPRPHDPGMNAIDQRRSLPARAFLPLLRIVEVADVRFVSLQKGAASQPQIADLPANLRPFDPMGGVHDFADTAAIIECLDLVITVDTSVAHLAGALNKPVWILSRYDGCWRWLRERDDSPWYPRARLFRQTEPGNWAGVIHRVTQALESLLKP